MLNILEITHTIMGESKQQGEPCTIVRLAGCNLNCTWCDTPQRNNVGSPWTIEAIVVRIAEDRKAAYGSTQKHNVLITGGEPFLQEEGLNKLVHRLLVDKTNAVGATFDTEVIIETNGSLSIANLPHGVYGLHIVMDVKGPSSGEVGKTDWSNLVPTGFSFLFGELKFVVATEQDLDYANQILLQYTELAYRRMVIISPVIIAGEGEESWYKRVGEFVTNHPLPLKLQLQLHKQINMP